MPKKIITGANLPKVLRELDRWEGKLTWSLFCTRVAKVLGVESISRHTMYYHPAISDAFRQRQADLRESQVRVPKDFTLEVALRRVADLEAQVRRLEATNLELLDRFRKWQYNAYAHNVRMDKLDWDTPLPMVDRSGKRRGKKNAGRRGRRASGSG